MLRKFIPEGAPHGHYLLQLLTKWVCAGVETDLAKFNEHVEEDAVNFKPYGKKIYEYTKRASGDAEGEERQYEVWHVRTPSSSRLRHPCFSVANGCL